MISEQSKSSSSSKKVRFSKRVLVRPVLSIYNYREKEVDSCWYRREELNEVRRETFETVHRMLILGDDSSSVQEDDCTYCTRGLVHYTEEGYKSRKSNRRKACRAVLEEQARQYDANERMDDERIAEIYSNLTASPILEAYVRGLEYRKDCTPFCCYEDGVIVHETATVESGEPCRPLMQRSLSTRLGKYHQRCISKASTTSRKLVRVTPQ